MARPRAAPAASKQNGSYSVGSWRQPPSEAGDELLEIVEGVEARRSSHPRRHDDVVEPEKLVVVRDRLLIVDVQCDAAEPAGAQRLDQGRAVNDRGVRH